MEDPVSMARRKLWMIVAMAFVFGFLSGVAFSAYKLGGFGAPKASKATHDIKYAEMAQALETEVADNPGNTNAWVQLGNVYFDTDQNQKAADAYTKALALNPQNTDVLTALGILYQRTGQPHQALQSFEKAIAVDSKNERARFNKGFVLLNDLKDRDGAIRTWKELLEINPLAVTGDNQSVDQLIKHYTEHETGNAK